MFKSFKNQSNAQEIVSFIAHCSKILLIKEIFVKTPKIFPKAIKSITTILELCSVWLILINKIFNYFKELFTKIKNKIKFM